MFDETLRNWVPYDFQQFLSWKILPKSRRRFFLPFFLVISLQFMFPHTAKNSKGTKSSSHALTWQRRGKRPKNVNLKGRLGSTRIQLRIKSKKMNHSWRCNHQWQCVILSIDRCQSRSPLSWYRTGSWRRMPSTLLNSFLVTWATDQSKASLLRSWLWNSLPRAGIRQFLETRFIYSCVNRPRIIFDRK